jgi:hypothetical protein
MATGYSLLVEYSQLRKDSATGQGAQYDVNLDVGSVDDQLQDSLRPGDVLLIRREPYRHHIPTALALIAYHWLYQSDFDLSAVVVRDPSSHRVKVLQPSDYVRPDLFSSSSQSFGEGGKASRNNENASGNGWSLVNYDDLLRSTAVSCRHIVLLPLLPRGLEEEDQSEQSTALLAFAEVRLGSQSQEVSLTRGGELERGGMDVGPTVTVRPGGLRALWNCLLTGAPCPSTQLVIDSLKESAKVAMSSRPSPATERVPATVGGGDIRLEPSKLQCCDDLLGGVTTSYADPKGKVVRLGRPIPIRSR